MDPLPRKERRKAIREAIKEENKHEPVPRQLWFHCKKCGLIFNKMVLSLADIDKFTVNVSDKEKYHLCDSCFIASMVCPVPID